MANGQISLGHDKFLEYASSRGCGYGGSPSNAALKEIQRDINSTGQTIKGFRWMHTFNAMRYWLPTSRNPVRPRMCYRQSLHRLTEGEIHIDDWDKIVRIHDRSPWYPGMTND